MVLDNPYDLIKTIAEAQETFGHSEIWWRGQPAASLSLIPGAYRDNRHSNYEQNVALRFQAKAPARYSNCPSNNADWLVLMQHYRLPTRLLDWTEAPLIALFFAVSPTQDDAEPAVLWGLDPYTLNKHQTGLGGVLTTTNSIATPIFKGAFTSTPPPNSDKTVAISPSQIDIRMLLQQSKFTLHGTRTPLEESADNEKFLQKIEIPVAHKEIVWFILRNLLSMNTSDLFPDLHHLAQDLEQWRHEENFQIT